MGYFGSRRSAITASGVPCPHKNNSIPAIEGIAWKPGTTSPSFVRIICSPTPHVLLAHPECMAHGLELTKASLSPTTGEVNQEDQGPTPAKRWGVMRITCPAGGLSMGGKLTPGPR